MSDLTETANNTKWKVRLGVNSGEVISVASREVTVARVSSEAERKISERPVIDIQLQLGVDERSLTDLPLSGGADPGDGDLPAGH